MNDSSHPSRGELLSRLDSLPLAEVRRFRRRLDKARAPQALRAIADDLDAAEMEWLELEEKKSALAG